MLRNGYSGASGRKSNPAVRCGDIDFLNDKYISTIACCLRHLFNVLCTIFSWPSDLDFRSVVLDGVWWIKIHTSDVHTCFLSALNAFCGYPFLSYDQADHITITWNGHCACTVSRDLYIGSPRQPHVAIFWPRIFCLLYDCFETRRRLMAAYSIEKPSAVKISPENGGFSTILGYKYKTLSKW